VFELYAEVRRLRDPMAAWNLWRDTRNELFAAHPQTPLPKETRATFKGLPYYEYDPELRVFATVEPAERARREIATSGEHPYSFTRFARAVDFNFAYNPSCCYDPRWVCPLAPPGNRLSIAIRGGERYPV
jgi:hypothetical protein